MKLTLESTPKIVNASGVDCRVWEGATASGIKVQCLIARVAVADGENLTEFERELKEQRAPSVGPQAFDMRLIL